MRILVFGGRDFVDWDKLNRVLSNVHGKRGITTIIQGNAKGADQLANRWARENGIRCETYYPDWDTHGRAAGPIRNQWMLDEGEPEGAIAFPGGRGTNDMKSRCEKVGVKVMVVQ